MKPARADLWKGRVLNPSVHGRGGFTKPARTAFQSIDLEFASRANVFHRRLAGWAGVVNANFWAILLLAAVAESNQGCFANHQRGVSQKCLASLHLEGKLQTSRFHTGKLPNGQVYLGNGGAIGLCLPPIFDREDQCFGHIGFMHNSRKVALILGFWILDQ
jgi:hypothetical protein